MDCSMPGFPVCHQFPGVAQTHDHKLVMPSNHLILCHPLLLLPSIFPRSGSFAVSQFFTSTDQSNGVWASESVLSMNVQDWFPSELMTGSPCGPRGSQESSLTPQFKSINSWVLSFLYSPTLKPYITTRKAIALTRWNFVVKVMFLPFNILSRLVIASLPRNKHLLISWLQSPSAAILEPQKIVSQHFHCFPTYLPWSDGTGGCDLSFLNVEV